MEHLTLKVAREPLNKGANQNLSYRACMALLREACLINPCVLDLFSINIWPMNDNFISSFPILICIYFLQPCGDYDF